MIDSQTIRLEAIKAVSLVSEECQGIGNLLAHAQWVEQYIQSGRLPEPEIIDYKADPVKQ